MPWPEKQRQAIFLAVKRRKGEKAAKRLMHKHGHGGKSDSKGVGKAAKRRKRKGR